MSEKDTIYRQDAIDVLAEMQGRCTSKEALIQNSKIWQQIKDLPSAERPRWIPCSERPPRYDETDETSEYLVTDKDGRVRHCCLDPYMPETFITVEEGMIVDAVAWRPAPEPYCKTESHEREGE